MRQILHKQRPVETSNSRLSISVLGFFALMLILLASALVMRHQSTPESTVLTLNTKAEGTEETSAFSRPAKAEPTYPSKLPELAVAIRKRIDETEGVYSVRFESFSTQESFGINDELMMTAASVIKIPILAALYSRAKAGTIDLSDTMTIPLQDVQDWGTGTIRYQEPPLTYSLRELARLLMEKSDNTAAYVLTHRVIGQNELQEMVEAWGLTGTNVKTNDTTNKDMNKLLNLMRTGVIAGEMTDEMLGWMDDSDFEDRLPFLLPDDVTVYHKIGNEVRVVNDVGIIARDGKPEYYLGVMTAEIPDEAETKRAIAEISKMVYEYHFQVDSE